MLPSTEGVISRSPENCDFIQRLYPHKDQIDISKEGLVYWRDFGLVRKIWISKNGFAAAISGRQFNIIKMIGALREINVGKLSFDNFCSYTEELAYHNGVSFIAIDPNQDAFKTSSSSSIIYDPLGHPIIRRGCIIGSGNDFVNKAMGSFRSSEIGAPYLKGDLLFGVFLASKILYFLNLALYSRWARLPDSYWAQNSSPWGGIFEGFFFCPVELVWRPLSTVSSALCHFDGNRLWNRKYVMPRTDRGGSISKLSVYHGKTDLDLHRSLPRVVNFRVSDFFGTHANVAAVQSGTELSDEALLDILVLDNGKSYGFYECMNMAPKAKFVEDEVEFSIGLELVRYLSQDLSRNKTGCGPFTSS